MIKLTKKNEAEILPLIKERLMDLMRFEMNLSGPTYYDQPFVSFDLSGVETLGYQDVRVPYRYFLQLLSEVKGRYGFV